MSSITHFNILKPIQIVSSYKGGFLFLNFLSLQMANLQVIILSINISSYIIPVTFLTTGKGEDEREKFLVLMELCFY